MRKKIIITTIAIISLTAAIAAKNHTPAANTNSIACTADMQKSIAGKILRFHVLANSDSEADQNVKKQVRDAVGAYIEPYLLECENIEETRATVNDHMDEIIAVSKETLAENGFTYGASAELTHTDFPEKTYGDYTFPEGNYEALEITLGDGAGHNWWCVLYPNMCFRGSVYEVVEDEAKENLKEVLTPDEYESIFDSGKYEIKLKIYTLVDIPTEQLLGKEAAFIDSALGLDDQWIKYHEDNKYKLYSYDMLYPIEKDGGYLKDHIYTFRIRTVNVELAKYFSKVLPNHYTRELKGLVAENRILPKKTISEIYTLTPVVTKFADGYWRGKYPIEVFEQRLFSNAVKKYKQYTGEEVNEDFQWYTQITFLNKKPIALSYDSKKITLLGDKINLKIADNKQAQELTYFMLGAGLGELNSRGAGTCNYRYL
mgnify:FL=1